MIVQLQVPSQRHLSTKKITDRAESVVSLPMSAGGFLVATQKKLQHDFGGAAGLVEVDGAVHVVAREEVRLGGAEALPREVKPLAGRVGAQLRQHPSQVKVAVVGARGVAVAQEVVAAVGVELSADDP